MSVLTFLQPPLLQPLRFSRRILHSSAANDIPKRPQARDGLLSDQLSSMCSFTLLI
jgi:hypothetical protein